MRIRLSSREAALIQQVRSVIERSTGLADGFISARSLFPEDSPEQVRQRRALIRCLAKGWLEWDGSLFTPAYRLTSLVFGAQPQAEILYIANDAGSRRSASGARRRAAARAGAMAGELRRCAA